MPASTSASPIRAPRRCTLSQRWTTCPPCGASSASSRESSPVPPTGTGASPGPPRPRCCISDRASATGWPISTTRGGPGRRSSTSWATMRRTTPATTLPCSRTSRPSPGRCRGGTARRRARMTWPPTAPTLWPPRSGLRAAWPRWSCRPTLPGRSRPRVPARPGRGGAPPWCRPTPLTRWRRRCGVASALRSCWAGARCGPRGCRRPAGWR